MTPEKILIYTALSLSILSLMLLFWFVIKLYKRIYSSNWDISHKYEDLERILLDLRDGTRTFHKEKRRSPRVAGDITAQIVGKKDFSGYVRVSNISEYGALLSMSKDLKIGETIELNMYLPIFPQPIHVNSKVVRVIPPKEKTGIFDTGVEFIDIAREDKEKLIETVKILAKKRA